MNMVSSRETMASKTNQPVSTSHHPLPSTRDYHNVLLVPAARAIIATPRPHGRLRWGWGGITADLSVAQRTGIRSSDTQVEIHRASRNMGDAQQTAKSAGVSDFDIRSATMHHDASSRFAEGGGTGQ
ncbi:MAG: hypothetical protein LQ340_001334 [Diploschistes diacapsis]|nr:MAG: hypothetical protein LQ340_001334 [Diploschistes diacapsis]